MPLSYLLNNERILVHFENEFYTTAQKAQHDFYWHGRLVEEEDSDLNLIRAYEEDFYAKFALALFYLDLIEENS